MKKILITLLLSCLFITQVYSAQTAMSSQVSPGDTKEKTSENIKLILGNEALTVVKNATDEILKALDKEKGKLKNNYLFVYELIEKHFVPHFDIDHITKRIAGVAWRKATDEQKVRIRAAIYDWIIRFFVKTVAKYEGQTISFLPVTENDVNLEKKTVQVKSKLNDAGVIYNVTYDLQQGNSQWKVIDLNAEGLQMIINFRTQFNQSYSSKGIDGTLETFNELAAKFREKHKVEP